MHGARALLADSCLSWTPCEGAHWPGFGLYYALHVNSIYITFFKLKKVGPLISLICFLRCEVFALIVTEMFINKWIVISAFVNQT